MDRTCRTCSLFDNSGSGGNIGICRKRSPTVLIGRSILEGWPRVRTIDWCGEWREHWKASPDVVTRTPCGAQFLDIGEAWEHEVTCPQCCAKKGETWEEYKKRTNCVGDGRLVTDIARVEGEAFPIGARVIAVNTEETFFTKGDTGVVTGHSNIGDLVRVKWKAGNECHANLSDIAISEVYYRTLRDGDV